MAHVTLIMTRQPLQEFLWERGAYDDIDDEEERTLRFGALNEQGRRVNPAQPSRGLRSGQWGTLVVVEGPVVLAVSRFENALTERFAVRAMNFVMGDALKTETITIAGRPVWLLTNGEPLNVLEELDTMERFRTDSDKNAFYVRLPARPQAYDLDCSTASNVEAFHKKLGIRRGKPGMCLRARDHNQKTAGGNMAGILLHEAPTVGWLIGCISPRLPGNRTLDVDISVCVDALDVIYEAMGGYARGKSVPMYVVD